MADYNWTDTRASTWYEGYDDKTNAGSFVNLKDLKGKAGYDKALASVTENVIGLFEQKGLTRAQAQDSDEMKAVMAKALAGDTKGAFQAAAKSGTSAVTRGDAWGADASEGGDEGRGRSYLEGLAASKTTGAATLNQINDLYEKGFGRAPDREGLLHWGSSGQSLSEIAKMFADSEEAKLRDVYHEEYGRDLDEEGTAYWLGHTGKADYDKEWDARKAAAEKKAKETGKPVDWTDSKNWGDHQAVDHTSDVKRIISHRTADGSNMAAETVIRDTAAKVLGQTSTTADRASAIGAGYFTAMENTGVEKWMEEIQSGKTTLQDVKDKLVERANIMDTYNVFDVDDYDKDGAKPTNMGRFGSLKDIKAHIDSGDSLEDLATRLGKETWGALSNEKFKDPKDFDYGGITDPFIPGNETWKKDRKTRTTPGEGWKPDIPDKPDSHKPFKATEKDINYMPKLTSDVKDTSKYSTAKGQYDTAMAAAKPDVKTAAPQTIGERFTGTSAKGVRMKRSKASRMGTIRGTKQLGREQQTKSLNI